MNTPDFVPEIVKIDRTNPNTIKFIFGDTNFTLINNDNQIRNIQRDEIMTKAYFLWLNGHSNNPEINWHEAEIQLQNN